MKPRQRREWIARYIAEHEPRSGVDVLNQAFVESYIEATGAKFAFMMWGAHKCPQLGRDLKAMRQLGQLKRGRVGLAGNWQPGFPKWVWSYSLSPKCDAVHS